MATWLWDRKHWEPVKRKSININGANIQTSGSLCLTDIVCVADNCLQWTPLPNSRDGLCGLDPGENPTSAVDWLKQPDFHALKPQAGTSGEKHDQAPTEQDKISVIHRQPHRYHPSPAFSVEPVNYLS